MQTAEESSAMSKLPHHDELEFPFCDDVVKYEKLAKIGQGTFGFVNA